MRRTALEKITASNPRRAIKTENALAKRRERFLFLPVDYNQLSTKAASRRSYQERSVGHEIANRKVG